MTSLLEEEIASQPRVVARLLDHELAHIQRTVAALPPFRYVVIAARGSSDHAALYAKYAWGALAGYSVALAAPALYTLYGAPPRLEGALVIGISQSGQSPDIVAVVEEAKRQGCPTLAICNDAASPLAAAADTAINLHAGAERSVAATKTYTAELVTMAALAACLSRDPARLDELRRLPAAMEAALAERVRGRPSRCRALAPDGPLRRAGARLQFRHRLRAGPQTQRVDLPDGRGLFLRRFSPRPHRLARPRLGGAAGDARRRGLRRHAGAGRAICVSAARISR